MKALWFKERLELREVPRPTRLPGEVLLEVTLAGICNTDLEITRGYVPGFDGIPGHEFIGRVVEADDQSLIGKRATAEINCACGSCDWCRKGLGRHCPTRTVLGIINRNGAFAEYVTVPLTNLVIIPDRLADQIAIFIEPLAAALEIFEQLDLRQGMSVLLLGDGKLAQLIALALAGHGLSPTVVGKHRDKLDLIRELTGSLGHTAQPACRTLLLSELAPGQYDVVIEASGNASAFETAVRHVKPRGVIVLKSTYAGGLNFNPAPLVVNEITLLGSRCGRFEAALDFLQQHTPPLPNLISTTFPLSQGVQAFAAAQSPGSLKVIVSCGQ